MINEFNGSFNLNPQQKNEIFNYLSCDGKKEVGVEEFADLLSRLDDVKEILEKSGSRLKLTPEQFGFVEERVEELSKIQKLEDFVLYVKQSCEADELGFDDSAIEDLFEEFLSYYYNHSDHQAFLQDLNPEFVEEEVSNTVFLNSSKGETSKLYDNCVNKLDKLAKQIFFLKNNKEPLCLLDEQRELVS